MAEKIKKAKKDEERFAITYKQSSGFAEIQIWIDKETGVNYVYNAQGYGAGFTPLLDADGKPIITPLSEIKED